MFNSYFYLLYMSSEMMSEKPNGLSIVIPVLNEKENIEQLLQRINATLHDSIPYEVVIIDDHSTDGSYELLQALQGQYPLRIFLKKGRKGKAESLREGFRRAKYDVLAFIDADLQYPPEAFGPMYVRLIDGQFDIVTTERHEQKEISAMRKILSKLYHFAIVQTIFGLPYDTQSGLKMFDRSVLPIALASSTGWNFDLPFLWHATRLHKRIAVQPITFFARSGGSSKLNSFWASLSMAVHSLGLRFRPMAPLVIHDVNLPRQAGSGVVHKGKTFVTHTELDTGDSAIHTITIGQWLAIAFVLALLVAGFFSNWRGALVALVTVVSVFYLADLLYMLFLSTKSIIKPGEIVVAAMDVDQLKDDELPIYSVLCPLYKEQAILSQFVDGINNLDWPKNKLDVKLLFEEDDIETIQAAKDMSLPPWIQIVVVPHSEPKTKPKACNYGLSYVSGDYVVIFDAEDVPEPDQLKKVYLAFSRSADELVCIQAKLSYYNASQNFLTRLFATEYFLWFGLVLPGLQSLNAPIPLGGTSNHFRREVLEQLCGWDPFNVTEDCDLGIRLFRMGYKTAVIDSYTHEEASSRLKGWIRQRSRWIKGYMQTFLVSMRRPWQLRQQGTWQLLSFLLTVGGKAFSIFVNPIFWLLTIGYVIARPVFGPVVETLFPPVLVYIGAISLLVGNFMYFYSHMLAVAKTKQWWLMKYVFLVPLYWLLMSVAGWYALWQLITKPHYWEKTTHGLHIKEDENSWIAWWRDTLMLKFAGLFSRKAE